MRRFIRFVLVTALLLPAAAHADTLNYTITFSANDPGKASVTGSGSFSIDTATSKLSAFSFTDTIVNLATDPFLPGAFTSTYTYTLSDLSTSFSPEVVLDPTSRTLDQLSLVTNFIVGTSGPTIAEFALSYGPNFTPISHAYLEGETVVGNSVVTQVTSPVPEPSSLALLGTGVLSLIATTRRRFLHA
jgi:hypothetical protein